MIEKPCARCGQAFSSYPSQKRTYCGTQCSSAAKAAAGAPKVDRTCIVCGATYSVYAARAAKNQGHTCSRRCAARAREKGALVACRQCGTPHWREASKPPSQGWYCSKKCSGGAARNRVTYPCQRCGKSITRPVSLADRPYCGEACAFPGPVDRMCEKCDRPFRATRWELARGWGRFCSNECRRTRVAIACANCGKIREVKASVALLHDRYYCGVRCRGLGRRNRVEGVCTQCGGAVSPRPASRARGARFFCSPRCLVTWRRTDSQELDRVRQMQRDHLHTRGPTRCERALYSLMDDVFGAGEWHREQLVFKWTVDAAVLKLRLAVQADGDYWHGLLPGSANDPRVAGNIANDRRQERYLHAAGWTVLRFWESELLRRPDDCRRELLYARGATGLPAGVDSAT